LHAASHARLTGLPSPSAERRAKILSRAAQRQLSVAAPAANTLFYKLRVAAPGVLHAGCERFMDALAIAAASGMRARMQSLDMLANNLANAETSGYKTDREFYNLYLGQEATADTAALPVIERPWVDFAQGSLRPTGNGLDLGLSGKGFFAVQGAGGPLYTRNGSFRLSPAGLLVTAEGYAVRTAGGGTLQADPSAPLEVAADGAVSQKGQPLGRLELVNFTDTGSLAKQGAGYFRSTQTGSPASGLEIRQGSLEDSNVGVPQSAVRLVAVMRQFEMLQKAVSLGSQMNREVIEEVARVAT
jgi:flagellar basal-body rod protein FlgF